MARSDRDRSSLSPDFTADCSTALLALARTLSSRSSATSGSWPRLFLLRRRRDSADRLLLRARSRSPVPETQFACPTSGSGCDGSLHGVWTIAGTDDRGAYDGQLELRTDGMCTIDAICVAHYATATV